MITLRGFSYIKDKYGNLHRKLSDKEYGDLLDFYSKSIYFGGKFWGKELLSFQDAELKPYIEKEEIKVFELKTIIEQLIPNFGAVGNLLEIGCGIGSFLKQLETSKLLLFGYDISSLASAGSNKIWTNKRFKIIKCEVLERIQLESNNNYWDYIASFDFLEHFKMDLLLVDRLKSILKPNGKLIFEVPIFNTENMAELEYEEFLFPEHHIHLYCEQGLDALFKYLGYKILAKKRIRNNKKIIYVLEGLLAEA